MDPATLNPVTFTVTGPGSTVVTGQVTYDVPDNIVTFTPVSPLAANTEFTATINGASDLAGNSLPNYVWTFTTGATATGLSPIDLGAATNFAVFAGSHRHQCRCDSRQRRSWFDAGYLGDRIPARNYERDDPDQ